MQSKALVCDAAQSFTLADVVLPDPGPDRMLVRTQATGVSIGTEFALIRNKLSWGPYPLCTGYQGVGVVEQIGGNVEGFTVGAQVYFRDNKDIQLLSGQRVSPVAGTHCAHAVINPKQTHGVALLPDGVPADVGSLFVMPSVGLYGVDMANPRMGGSVVVYGAGMIGLGVVAACVHRGCATAAVDILDKRLEAARLLGADHLVNAATQDVAAEINAVFPGGADVVFEASGIPALVDKAIALCKPHGTFVWQGNYGADPISMHFLPPHGKRLTMHFPCDDGMAPCRRAVMRNMAMGALRWERVITHRVEPEDAAGLFDRINKNQADDVIGAVIHWSD